MNLFARTIGHDQTLFEINLVRSQRTVSRLQLILKLYIEYVTHSLHYMNVKHVRVHYRPEIIKMEYRLKSNGNLNIKEFMQWVG